MPHFYICSRPSLDAVTAHLVADLLDDTYGADAAIAHFAPRLETTPPDSAEIAAATVMILLISPHWLDLLRRAGPSDRVRAELEAAAAARRTILPVLIGAVDHPQQNALPPALRRYAFRHAYETRIDPGDLWASLNAVGQGASVALGFAEGRLPAPELVTVWTPARED